jgi:hypothetical protein
MVITNTTADLPSKPVPFVWNRIAECRTVNKRNVHVLPRPALSHLVIHRTDLDHLDPVANPNPVPNELLDGPALALRFNNPGLGTGGAIPYHFLLRSDPGLWTLEQLLPLSVRGAHAVGFNWRGIGVAAVGDFRKYAPPAEQYDKLVKLVALLIPIQRGLITAGHTDLAGASADANKVCPGAFLPVKVLAASALATLPTDWNLWPASEVDARLVAAGITL